jgi:hypothetical protein
MEARPRKGTGYMRGEMRSGGECARATDMPATAANVNATTMKTAAATAEAAAAVEAASTPTVEATAAAVKTATTAAMASAASRAGLRRSGQQHRASQRDNA